MHVDRDAVRAAAIHRTDTAAGRLQKLDQTRYQFISLLVVTQTANPTESPGERTVLTVDCNGMIVTAAKVCDLNTIQRRRMAVLTPLDVQNDSLRHFLVMKCHFRIRDEVFAIGVVAQSTVLWTSERVQATLDVQDHRELCAASYFHYRRSGILYFGGSNDTRIIFADPALAQFIVAGGENYTAAR